MDNRPLISIIVPCYGVELYLPKCIESIIHQTYTNLEILLVDDGSLDKSGEICDAYARSDCRINVIHKPNGGLADARNVALDVAKGEWIICIDSDDFVSLDYVETLFHLVEKNQCKIGVAQHKEFYDGTGPETSTPPYEEYVFDKKEGLQKMFYQELFDTAAWCKIYHRSLFDFGVRYPLGLIYEDLPTTYLLFLKTDKVAYCNRIIYYYLLRNNSLEGQPFNVKKLDSAVEILKMIQSHAEELQSVEKAVRCRLISFCFHILLEMPTDYADNRKQILLNYVKVNRWKVLMDKRARFKARLGIAVSLLGMNVARKILNRIKIRNKQ